MGEKITIITVSFNAENEIGNTLLSVLQQTYRPLEYILVDGASTDNTNEIIQGYKGKLMDVGIDLRHISEKDKGISDAFNKGIRMASGSLIGILNTGDYYTKDILCLIADKIKSETDVICGDIIWSDSKRGMEYVRRSSSDWSRLQHGMTVMHPSCFVRKSAYKKYGCFDCNYQYAMDFELLSRFWREKAKFQYIPVLVAKMQADGVSDKGSPNMYREIQQILISNGYGNIRAILSIHAKKMHNNLAQWIKNTNYLKDIFLQYKGR